jgi:hypothetical protein
MHLDGASVITCAVLHFATVAYLTHHHRHDGCISAIKEQVFPWLRHTMGCGDDVQTKPRFLVLNPQGVHLVAGVLHADIVSSNALAVLSYCLS